MTQKLFEEIVEAAKTSLQDYDPKAILDAGDSAIKAASKKVADDLKTGALGDDLKSAAGDEKAVEDATKKALEGGAVEEAAKTAGDAEAVKGVLDKFEKKEESILLKYNRVKEDITDSLGLTDAMNNYAAFGDLDAVVQPEEDEDLVLARTLCPEIDGIYEGLKSGSMDEITFTDHLESFGVPDEIIISLIEKAFDITPDYTETKSFEPTEDVVIMARELTQRGMSDEDIIETLVQKYDMTEEEAGIIIDTVKDTDLQTEIKEPELSPLSTETIVAGGEDVTDSWEQKFETAIDEFDSSIPDDQPYEDEDLYDYLYKKFEVPEDEAVSILSNSGMNIPKAIIILCEHCQNR
jgi:hypothetical protein